MMPRLAGNVFWSGLEAASAAAMSFASAFIVARLIGPGEVGIAAAAVSVHVLLWVTVNALFADAIVQRATLEDVVLTSAFWASTLAGVVAALVQFGAGPLLGRLLGDPRLPLMAMVLAAPLPLVGAGGAMQGVLTRRRDYRALAGRTLIGQGLGTMTAISAAAMGAGAWALVLQQAITASAGAVALLIRGRGYRMARPNWQATRELLALGLPLTASTLVQFGRYRLFALLIGGTAGAVPLGEVHLAFRMVDTVRDLTFTALWRLMLPALSARQRDLVALRQGLDRCLGLSALVVLPLLGAMALVVVPLSGWVLGPTWVSSGVAALPLIALTAWLFLWFPSGAALIARGVAQPALTANCAAVAAMLVGVAVVRPATPGQAIWVWLAAQLVTSPYTIRQTARVLGVGLMRPPRAGLPALAATAIAVAVGLLVPAMLGVSGDGPTLIAARLAASVPVGLLGVVVCMMRAGWLAGWPGPTARITPSPGET